MEIQKGVPLPIIETSNVYPFDKMEPGDCLHVPNRSAKTVRHAVFNYRRKNPQRRFVVRETDDGTRVWRIDSVPGVEASDEEAAA